MENRKPYQIRKKYENHDLHKKYTFEELLIIGSLLEKEGKDNFDKKLIFSVIKNIPIKSIDKLHMWIGIRLAQGKSIE